MFLSLHYMANPPFVSHTSAVSGLVLLARFRNGAYDVNQYIVVKPTTMGASESAVTVTRFSSGAADRSVRNFL